MSPGSRSLISINTESSEASSYQQRQEPPPYRQPPDVSHLGAFTKTQYKECVDEFAECMSSFASRKNSFENIIEDNSAPTLPPRRSIDQRSISLDQPEKIDYNKENTAIEMTSVENAESKFSVKQAMMKFNRYASDEDAKIPSPLGKNKKPDKVSTIEKYINV